MRNYDDERKRLMRTVEVALVVCGLAGVAFIFLMRGWTAHSKIAHADLITDAPLIVGLTVIYWWGGFRLKRLKDEFKRDDP